MFKVLFFFFLSSFSALLYKLSTQDFWAAGRAGILWLLSATEIRQKKASLRSRSLFLVFLMQVFVFSYVYISWEREGRVFPICLFFMALQIFVDVVLSSW